MKLILVSLLAMFLPACTPEFFKTADDILTNDAITVQVDKDAFQKDTDVRVNVEVVNKEPPK